MLSLLKKIYKKLFPAKDYYSYSNLQTLTDEELKSLLRHDCHRIEKSMYNELNVSKYSYYSRRNENVGKILSILDDRGVDLTSQEFWWILEIHNNFDELQKEVY